MYWDKKGDFLCTYIHKTYTWMKCVEMNLKRVPIPHCWIISFREIVEKRCDLIVILKLFFIADIFLFVIYLNTS